MPVTIGWENSEKTILRYTIENDFTLDEIYDGLVTGYQLQDEVAPNGVWIIVDSIKNIQLQENLYKISSYMKRNRRENMRGTVIITTSMITRAIAELVIYMLNQQNIVYFASTTEKALEIIYSKQVLEDEKDVIPPTIRG